MVFSYVEVDTGRFHRAKKSPAGRLFLFWTVNGPFSLFLRQEKEKMGGSTHPPAMGMAAKKVPSLLFRWRGGSQGATGENAIVYQAARADLILGPIGSIMANGILGEVSPTMAAAVSVPP